MPEVDIVQTDKNVFQVKGVIDHESATALLPLGVKLFAESDSDSLIVDLSDARASNSTCPALLIAWLRHMKLKGKSIEYKGFSEKLLRIIKVSNLQNLLGVDQ